MMENRVGKGDEMMLKTRACAAARLVMMVFAVAALVAVTLPPQTAEAAGLWYVAPGGDDGNSCTSPGAPCVTINGAIGKASPGDTIYVAAGTYTGAGDRVVLLDKDAILSGGWDDTFTEQTAISTIDCQDSRRGIAVNTGVITIVERFAVHHGAGSAGGGISNGGTLTLSDSTVSGNAATWEGGGIYNYGTLILNNSTVSGNSASYGSGGGISNAHSDLGP